MCCALRYMLNSLRVAWGVWPVKLTLELSEPTSVGRPGMARSLPANHLDGLAFLCRIRRRLALTDSKRYRRGR